MKIKTDHKYREILYWDDLTEKEQEEFDWEYAENSGFFRYKKEVYCLEDFMRVFRGDALHTLNWDGVKGDPWSSGVIVRLSDYGNGVMVGRCYS